MVVFLGRTKALCYYWEPSSWAVLVLLNFQGFDVQVRTIKPIQRRIHRVVQRVMQRVHLHQRVPPLLLPRHKMQQ